MDPLSGQNTPPQPSTTPAPVSVQPSVPTLPVSPPPPPVPPAPKSHKKLFILVIFIALFLFSSAVLAFFMASRNQNLFEQTSQTPTPQPTIEPTPTPEPEITPTASPTSTPQPGAPTPTPSTEVQTKTITSMPNLDGYLASNGTANTTADIRSGRNAFAITRGFVAFDLSSIPSGVTIESATLRIYQINTDGSPYTTGGALKLDHVEYGASLEGEDYALAPLATGIATLTTNSTIEWKEALITEAVRNDITNHRPRTGIRVRFTTEKIGGEAGGDYAYFESSENFSGTGNIPQLIIRYR